MEKPVKRVTFEMDQDQTDDVSNDISYCPYWPLPDSSISSGTKTVSIIRIQERADTSNNLKRSSLSNKSSLRHQFICRRDVSFVNLRSAEYAVMSGHPVNKDFSIKIIPASEDAKDSDKRVGFGVWNNMVRSTNAFGSTEIMETTVHYNDLNDSVFRKSLRRGLLFTKLELNGNFFSESYLCPQNAATKTSYSSMLLPNLKHLIIRFNLTATLKGNNKTFNTVYIDKHHVHFRQLWSRASWNFWFILKTLTSMKLYSFVLEDTCKWESMIGFRKHFEDVLVQCQEPLLEFIQRHGSTLKILKLTRLLMNETLGRIRDNVPIPTLGELRFSGNMVYEIPSKLSGSQKMTLIREKMNRSLVPWRQFWSAQFNLRKLEWLCSKQNPWTYTKTDFIQLCKMNIYLESIVLTLHGATDLWKLYKTKRPVPKQADLRFNCKCIEGVAALKTLIISCFEEDAAADKMCIYNLDFLPKSLENVHIYGIRVLASELEHLAKLPCLKYLSIMQSTTRTFSTQDELNGNIEGVNINALKKIVNIRTLQQLALSGFPTRILNQNDGFVITQPITISGNRTLKTILKETKMAVDRNGTLLNWLKECFTGAAESSLDEDNLLLSDQNGNEGMMQDTYFKELHHLLTTLYDAGSVSEKEIYDGKKVTVVTVGDVSIPVDNLFHI